MARASPIAWEKSNSAIVYTIHFFMRSSYSVMEPHTASAQSSTFPRAHMLAPILPSREPVSLRMGMQTRGGSYQAKGVKDLRR